MKIDRRHFLGTMGVAGASSLLGCNLGGAPDADPGDDSVTGAQSGGVPNVLVILVDQERARRWFPEGIPLPAHDRLAQMGTTFAKHYTNAMPCTPSRSVIYTGQHVQRTRMRSNIGPGQLPMSIALTTLGDVLKARGYSTTYFGKWHLSEISEPDNCGATSNTVNALVGYGFDEYSPCGDLPGYALSGFEDDPDVASQTRSWLTRRAATNNQQPWLLCCNFVNPHDIMYFYGGPPGTGIGTTEPVDPLYGAQWNPQLPGNANDDLSNKPATQASYKELYDSLQHYPSDGAGLRRFINYYINCIRDVDRHMLAVLDALAASPYAQNTVVLFTSDHGEMAQAHGVRGKGPFVYEENNHVPLTIVDPRVPGAAGRRVDGLSCHLDLVPTVLGLTGLTLSQTRMLYPALKGIDLSPYLRGVVPNVNRSSLLMTFDYSDTVEPIGQPPGGVSTERRYLRGIFDGQFKFARYFATYNMPTTWEQLVANNDLELYNLVADPEERNNLAQTPDAYRPLIESLNARLNLLIQSEAGGEFPPGSHP